MTHVLKHRWTRIIELILLFLFLPLVYAFGLSNLPIYFVVIFISVYCLIMLLADPDFDRKSLWLNQFKSWKTIFLRFFLGVVLFVSLIAVFHPGAFFSTLLARPWLLAVALVSYPILSAYPQEIIYRTYFYHRYQHFFPTRNTAILANAVLFALAHIIFFNWIAILVTFVGGIVFSLTYLKSQSTFAAFVEHTLYGNFIFIIGIGEFISTW